MKKSHLNRLVGALDNLQVFSSVSLGVIGVFLIVYSFYDITVGFFSAYTEETTTLLLSNLSLIIIAIAILDVAKYVVEEAIARSAEIKSPREARQTLTKFIVIVFVAISLETIVNIFLASKQDFSQLVYPSLLLFTNTLLLVGLGIYQRFSTYVERRVDVDKG